MLTNHAYNQRRVSPSIRRGGKRISTGQGNTTLYKLGFRGVGMNSDPAQFAQRLLHHACTTIEDDRQSVHLCKLHQQVVALELTVCQTAVAANLTREGVIVACTPKGLKELHGQAQDFQMLHKTTMLAVINDEDMPIDELTKLSQASAKFLDCGMTILDDGNPQIFSQLIEETMILIEWENNFNGEKTKGGVLNALEAYRAEQKEKVQALASAVLPEEIVTPILKAGYLTKQGGGTTAFSRKNWLRRWFILQPPYLSYYKDEASIAKPLGTINLELITDVTIRVIGTEACVISIQTCLRTYQVRCTEIEEGRDWGSLIRAATESLCGSSHTKNRIIASSLDSRASASTSSCTRRRSTFVSKVVTDGPRRERPKYKQLLQHARALANLPTDSTKEKKDEINNTAIMNGDMAVRIPPLKIKVQIFVGSGGCGVDNDRRIILEDIKHFLHELCSNLGFTFELVNPSWNALQTTDHKMLEQCLSLAKEARRNSVATAFVAFLADSYGFRPLPPSISVEEFQKLLTRLGMNRRKDREIMKRWYKLDSNAVPPMMVLQTIPYGEDSKLGKKEQVKVLRNYAEQSSRLREALLVEVHGTAKLKKQRTAASIRQEATQMTSGSKDHFLPSIIETEVKAAVLDNKQSNRQCVIIDHKPTKGANKNRDGARLEVLKEKLNSVLPTNRIIQGKDLCPEEIADAVCDVVAADIMEARREITSDSLTREIRIHRDDIVEQVETIGFARSRLFKTMSKYTASVESNENYPPMLLHGGSGTGKSWLMAHTMLEELPGKPVRVFRRLGLTRESTTPQQLLLSICSQIYRAYGRDGSPPCGFLELNSAFKECLEMATKGQPLLVVLDGLEKMHLPRELGSEFSWLRLNERLPPHCRFIVSCSSTSSNVLEQVRTSTKCSGALEVDSFLLGTENIATPTLILLMNQRFQRTMSQPIANLLLRALRKSPCVQTLEMLLAIASFWTETSPTPEMESIVEVVDKPLVDIADYYLDILEARNGTNFVRAVMNVLMTAKEGLSDEEVTELLTLQSKNLCELQGTLKKKAKNETFPAVWWYRLKTDMKAILFEKTFEGVTLRGVKHLCCRAAVERRYLKDPVAKKTAHALLAKYFSGVLTDKKASSQPLRHPSGLPNGRRIIELPYHLMNSGQQIELYRVLSDFDFINAACDSELMVCLYNSMEEAMSEFGQEGYEVIAPFIAQVSDRLNGHKGVKFAQVALLAPHQQLLARRGMETIEALDSFDKQLAFKYLRKPLLPLRERPVTNHAAEVAMMKFGGQHDLLLTCAKDGNVKIHSSSSETVHSFHPGAGYIVNCAVSDSNTFVLCSNKGIVSAWKVKDEPEQIASIKLDGVVVSSSLSRSGGEVALVTDKGSLHLWSPKQSPSESTKIVEEGTTSCRFNMAVTVASCHTDGTLKLWNGENGEMQCSIVAHEGPVLDVDFMLRDSQFITIGKDKRIKVWDSVQCEELASLGDETREHIMVKTKGSNIACADNCGTIRIWSNKLIAGSKRKKRIQPVCEILRPLDVIGEEVTSQANLHFELRNDGKAIAAKTTTGVGIWTSATGRLNTVLPGDWTYFSFSKHDTLSFATGSPSGEVKIWDLHNVLLSDRSPNIHQSAVSCLGLSSNGNCAASADTCGVVYFWSGEDGNVKNTIVPHVRPINSITCSEKETNILTASSDGTMVLIDSKKGKKMAVFEGHTDAVNDARFRIDEQMILSASDDWTVGLWDIQTENRVRTVKFHGGPVTSCMFSPVCGVVGFSASRDGTVHKFDLRENKLIGTANLGTPILCLDVSPYATTIVAGGENGVAYVLDGASMKTLFVLGGHTGSITGCSFSGMQSLPCIFTTSLDGTIKMWDDGNGQVVRTMIARGHPITSLATGAVDGKLRIMIGDKFGYTDYLEQWEC